MRRLLVAFVLALPLGAAHPVHLGNDLEIEVHLVDAASGRVHHPVDHQTQLGSVNPSSEPALTNRSYHLVVEMRKQGSPVDGRVGMRFNGTERYLPTTGGAAVFPLGHPPAGLFFAQVSALPATWQSTTWERFDFLGARGTGALEPEPLARWGFAAASEWSTRTWTTEAGGFGKFTLRWSDVANGPGGFLALLHYRFPDGTANWAYVWTAFDGSYAARVRVAYAGVEAAHAVDRPRIATSATSMAAQGDWPPGAIVTITQGVLSPNDPTLFKLEAEADIGAFVHAETARGAMAAYGADSFREGYQATATVAGLGQSTRSARVADLVLPAGGTVLLEAYIGESIGTYAWRYAGEEVTARFSQGARFWSFTGPCAGAWWLRVDAGRFGDESFALLHLAGHSFPAEVDANFAKPVGASTCRRIA